MKKRSLEPVGDKKLVHWKPCGKFNGWQASRCSGKMVKLDDTNQMIHPEIGGRMTCRQDLE